MLETRDVHSYLTPGINKPSKYSSAYFNKYNYREGEIAQMGCRKFIFKLWIAREFKAPEVCFFIVAASSSGVKQYSLFCLDQNIKHDN